MLAALALLLGLWGLVRFRAARTSPVPIRPVRALVIDGPYRFSRNPMYLALAMLYTAIVGLSGLTWALVLLPLTVPVVGRLMIRREERYLETRFGESYRAYRTRVRRWL